MLRQLILVAAGLVGASGVALAALAFHGGDASLGSAAQICLVHGPALIGLYLVGRDNRAACLAALVLVVGTVLFAGDIVMRHFAGSGFFAMAAPTGGTTMIVGWLLVAIAGVVGRRQAAS